MSQEFKLGWEEWVSLNELGLPALKVKVDTGAKTSALHAAEIQPFGTQARPQVRFLINPDPENPNLEIVCSAPIIDRRNITSSNGETEQRYVIGSTVEIGGRKWPLELTLTNRENMKFRMLLGRASVAQHFHVDPSGSYLIGKKRDLFDGETYPRS